MELITYHYHFDSENETIYDILLRDTDIGYFECSDSFITRTNELINNTDSLDTKLKLTRGKEQYIINNLYGSYEDVYNSVSSCGMNLANVPDEYKTEEICYEAVKSNPKAFAYVPFYNMSSRICNFVLRCNPTLIYLFPKYKRNEYIKLLSTPKLRDREIINKFIPLNEFENVDETYKMGFDLLKYFRTDIDERKTCITKFDIDVLYDLCAGTVDDLSIDDYISMLDIPYIKKTMFKELVDATSDLNYIYSEDIHEITISNNTVSQGKIKVLLNSYAGCEK